MGFEVDAFDVMEQLTDDLLYHGDLNSTGRRMMQQGFEDRNGERIQGMREMLERLRERRQVTLDRYDLGGVYDDIAERAARGGGQAERGQLSTPGESSPVTPAIGRRHELTEQSAAEKETWGFDMLPPDLAGQVKSLKQYEFVSAEAQERFEALMEKLREPADAAVRETRCRAMENISPEDMARMKDMLAELNHMLEQREAW